MANEIEPHESNLQPRVAESLLRACVRLAEFVLGGPPEYYADDPRYKDPWLPLLRSMPSALLTLRRQQEFSPTPGLLADADPTSRAREFISSLYEPFRADLSLERIRKHYCNLLYDLVNSTENFAASGSQAQLAFATREVAAILSQTGFALSYDIRTALGGEYRIPEVSPIGKYLTYPEVKQYANQKGLTALVHGSFDPFHERHCELIRSVYPFCDRVIVGVSNDAFLQGTKGKEDDPRPRCPLAWRLWEIAAHPMVDAVFVVPIKPEGDIDEAFFDLYMELNVKRLVSGYKNPLLSIFKQRMDQLGGQVVTSPEGFVSSTLIHGARANHTDEQRLEMNAYIESTAALAKSHGYLRDYSE